jgi:hypothetical protein
LGCSCAGLCPASRFGRRSRDCDSKLCGSVLCCRPGGTGCHDRQERGELDLLALIVEEWDGCRERFQHALEHARPVELLEKLAGARIEWSRHTTRRETG